MRDPTLSEVNTEIRRMKKLVKCNEETRDGLKFLNPSLDFINEVQKTIDQQKELIKCLENIKEKLS